MKETQVVVAVVVAVAVVVVALIVIPVVVAVVVVAECRDEWGWVRMRPVGCVAVGDAGKAKENSGVKVREAESVNVCGKIHVRRSGRHAELRLHVLRTCGLWDLLSSVWSLLRPSYRLGRSCRRENTGERRFLQVRDEKDVVVEGDDSDDESVDIFSFLGGGGNSPCLRPSMPPMSSSCAFSLSSSPPPSDRSLRRPWAS